MPTVLEDIDESLAPPDEEPEIEAVHGEESGWLVLQYLPVSLFSLKSSRATSTVGKTLVVPTPYAVKMAVLDAALRHGLTDQPNELVRSLARTEVRIGVPNHACVTGTIQNVRQETRDVDRKRNPELPPYKTSIALREFVCYRGVLRLAFGLQNAPVSLIPLLLQAAPAINYFGKRGSFFQYLGTLRQLRLDESYTRPVTEVDPESTVQGHRALLDDFGAKPSFNALSSYSSAEARRGTDRRFVDTFIPMRVYNTGPAFTHYVGEAG